MECGFFNSKGEDRLYNAEHFTSYLSSMICNGVQDTVGECFAPSVSEDDGLLLTIGSGRRGSMGITHRQRPAKSWISLHM